jgi:hypothetical protein
MKWDAQVRPSYKFDFEDWRKAEDSEFNKKQLPEGVWPRLRSRVLINFKEQGDGREFEIFWDSADQVDAQWTGSDEQASNIDDWLRELARVGNPEACLYLAGFRTNLKHFDEAARWIGRAEYLIETEENMPQLPAGENFNDYASFIETKIQDRLQDLSDALGRVPRIKQIKDIGPNSEVSYCAVCGVQLSAGVKSAACDGFFLDFWFDAHAQQPADLAAFEATHGSTNSATYDRWPAGIEGKIEQRGLVTMSKLF